MRTVKLRAISSAVVYLLGLTACAQFPRNEPGTSFGQITISSPRIEGRDRLINDRREQEQWVSQQITAFDKNGLTVNGSVDQRSLSAFAMQAAANLEPAIRLDNINRGRQADQARQDADDASVLNVYRTQQRDQIIADQKAGKITADDANDKLKKLGLDPAAARSSTAATATLTPAGVPTPLSGELIGGLKDGKFVPPDEMPRPTSANSSYLEDFNELLSGRETMMNIRNDLRMDDLHDLGGNTLYRLTFNAEVIPEDDSSAWAIARLKVTIPGVTSAAVDQLLSQAKARFDKQLDDRIWLMDRALLKRLNTPCWPQEDKPGKLVARNWNDTEHERAFRRAMRCATAGTSSDSRQALEQILVKKTLSNFGVDELKATEHHPLAWQKQRVQLQDGLLDRQTARESVTDFDGRRRQLHRWSLWLGEVMDTYREMQWRISVVNCFFPTSDQRAYDGPPIELPDCGSPSITEPKARLLALLSQSVSASVYAVTPRETVQRLSEVASNRRAAEFVASLSGLAGTAGISAGLQSLRVSDAYYAALRRKPLVVGFTEAGSATPGKDDRAELVFGWVLGPAFQISNDGKQTRFRHTVVQRSVSADLVLPAWLDHIQITPQTYWLKEDGTTVESANQSRPMTIRLPARPVDVLYAADARRERTPKIDRFQYLDVVVGKPAAVYIPGENVWRSTEVLIGAQRANSVYLLRDGVIASYDAVLQPYGADTKESGPDSGTVALTLLTSDGALEAGRVTVWPAKEKEVATAKLSFTGSVPRMVAGAEYAVALSQALKPNESVSLRVGSKKDTNMRVILEPQLADDRQHAVFVLPTQAKLKSGNSLIVDALVTRASGDIEVFNLVRNGAYYEKDTDLEATATGSRSKAADMVKVKVALPAGSSKGFASLTDGMGKLNANMEIKGENESLPFSVECPVKENENVKPVPTVTCEAVLNVPTSAQVNYKKAKDIKLSDMALKGDDVPKLKTDSLTVSLPAPVRVASAPAGAAAAAAAASSPKTAASAASQKPATSGKAFK